LPLAERVPRVEARYMAETASRTRTEPPPAGQAGSAIAAGARHSGLIRLVLPASMVVSFLAASSAPTPLYASYAQEWHFSPITVALSRIPPRTVMLYGIAATAAAAAGTLTAVAESSAAGFFASAVVAGIGLGAGLQGGFRTVISLASPLKRSGLVSVLYVICYCGMGAPSVVAGILVVHGGGLISSARDYALFIIVLAIAALAGLVLMSRSVRSRERLDKPSAASREPAGAADLLSNERSERAMTCDLAFGRRGATDAAADPAAQERQNQACRRLQPQHGGDRCCR
jgi:hypothetical protein